MVHNILNTERKIYSTMEHRKCYSKTIIHIHAQHWIHQWFITHNGPKNLKLISNIIIPLNHVTHIQTTFTSSDIGYWKEICRYFIKRGHPPTLVWLYHWLMHIWYTWNIPWYVHLYNNYTIFLHNFTTQLARGYYKKNYLPSCKVRQVHSMTTCRSIKANV